MVHITRLEMSNFKSFGGTTSIPVLPGFTVVSGPNGSGKSNILDALLFCLGISTSKGMRAERLPDLVNHNQSRSRGTVEASVTVTFDLGDSFGLIDIPNAPATASHDEFPVERQKSLQGEESEAIAPQSPESHSENGNGAAASQPSAAETLAATADREWSITRRLRVTKGGTYTSTYYMNGESCTLTQLHEQINRLRIYPEGYNVVLQGDVTAIISMNGKERREIIDELAGVAAFDRKIVQAKTKLDEVKEREDRCRIVENELKVQLERLSKDRTKAEQYQKLRAELHEKEQLAAVLEWRQLKQQEWKLREQIEGGDRQVTELGDQITTISGEIQQASTRLEELNNRVKALGEEELIALQSTLATQDAEHRQLQNRQGEQSANRQQTLAELAQTEQDVKELQQALQKLAEDRELEKNVIVSVQENRDGTQTLLNQKREQASAIASASEEWVQQQTNLHRQIETLQKNLDPQRTEQARLTERRGQLEQKIAEQQESLETSRQDLMNQQFARTDIEQRHQLAVQQVQSLAQTVSALEQDLQVQQETQKRLLEEQRDKQRRLDKLEAQSQAQQEASGTGASKVILQTGLPGVCGLVAQLGRVEPTYQMALETAAGGRLGYLVVEDDGVAAAAIELLKQKRAGRATFLPLNKIRPSRFSPIEALRNAPGFVDYAVNLIECDRPYLQIFAYIFGNTVVFENTNLARAYLGQARIVTLDGDLLESTGAMTGGSAPHRSSLRFGTGGNTESGEVTALQNRLQEIEAILERCTSAVATAGETVKQRSAQLVEAKQQQRELQLKSEQLEKEINSLTGAIAQLEQQLTKNSQELETATTQLQTLAADLPDQEVQLERWRLELSGMEESGTNSEWQQIQSQVRELESQLQEWEQSLSAAQLRQQDLGSQYQRLEEKIQDGQKELAQLRQQEIAGTETIAKLQSQLTSLGQEMAQTQAALAEIESKLGEEKTVRDQAEARLRELHLNRQQLEWQLQKLHETQQGRREQLVTMQQELQQREAELPDPQPPVPEAMEKRLATVLQELQKEVRSLQKRIEAMEPVNMLALEEYDRTQARLEELSQKLATLEGERTEILLRIENFTTLRLRAFKEAFDAVNENFQIIFAELSDGDGYLQLDDTEDPFSSGLSLVAHPKGKPVQRLASMSGGEKSLTALSFIFSLQRYRPSPFYAFDEVDMFLDGANVERLAKIIKQQADVAQFIVVSHKTPMLKLAERVIGVTQARGAYTQVIGLQIEPKTSAV